MKSQKTIFVALVLILLASFYAQRQDREQLTDPVSDPTKEIKLNANLITGIINFNGYNGKDIIIN